MSHGCANCECLCYCDGEDAPSKTLAWIVENCVHECVDEDDGDFFFEEEEPDDPRA